MRQITLDTSKETYQKITGVLGLVNKTRKGEYFIASYIQTCRGFMGQYILALKMKENKVKWETPPLEMTKFIYKSGYTYVGIYVQPQHKEKFLKNIEWLHEREDKAKVVHSEVLSTQIENLYVVEGAKYWKDSCWKIMLYTFYLRCCAAYANPEVATVGTNESVYWPNLKKNNNEDKLLANVKMNRKKEIFDKKLFYVSKDWGTVYHGKHDKEGFNSICTSKNPPMAKLLGLIGA